MKDDILSRLEGMTREELLELKVATDVEVGKIKAQLNDAKTRAAISGQYADPDWFTRASAALGIKGRVSQAIQTRLAILKQQQKLANIAASSGQATHDAQIRAAAMRRAERIARAFTDGISNKVAISTAHAIADRLAQEAEHIERAIPGSGPASAPP